MAVMQTDYRRASHTLAAGQIIDQQLASAITRVLAEGETIACGAAVFATADDSVVTAMPSERFNGITYRDRCIEPGHDDLFRSRAILPIARDGVVAVPVEGSVSKGQAAYVTPGKAITAASSGNFALEGAAFESSGTGVVQLRLSRIGE